MDICETETLHISLHLLITIIQFLQAKDENKLKAVQELSDSFDLIIAHPQYQTFLDHAMRVFIKILQVSEADSVADPDP